jgi:separase
LWAHCESNEQDLKNDERLQSFGAQYIAFSHLWLAFHAHQGGVEGSAEIIAIEARQALKIIREAFDSDIIGSPSITRIGPTSPLNKQVASPDATPVAVPIPKRRAPSRLTTKTPVVNRTLPGSFSSSRLLPISVLIYNPFQQLRLDQNLISLLRLL